MGAAAARFPPPPSVLWPGEEVEDVEEVSQGLFFFFDCDCYATRHACFPLTDVLVRA